MYLSAQRVRSPRGESGVNVLLFRHGEAVPGAILGLPVPETLARVSQQQPGKLFASRLALTPGGNSVEAFLDLVAPDDAPIERLEAAIVALRSRLDEERPQLRLDLVTAEFSMNRPGEDAHARFDELASAALELYRAPASPAWEAAVPLSVRVEHDEEGWIFSVEAADHERLRAAGGAPTRVRMRFDVADDFRAMHGNLYPHVAQWVTSLSAEQLLALGGARFFEGEQIVGEWPRRTR